jgi:hypothetical protein
MKLTAKIVPYSSVVGSSVTLHADNNLTVCQLALLSVIPGHFKFDKTAHKETSEQLAQFVTDKINAPATRWVKNEERTPAVGGTYFTGRWMGPTNGLRQFRLKRLFLMILEDNRPVWYSFDRNGDGSQRLAFPDFWLEGMPPPPADG